MWEIDADCPITRRLRLSHIYDDHGNVIFSHALLSACLIYALEDGQQAVLLRSEAGNVEITFNPTDAKTASRPDRASPRAG